MRSGKILLLALVGIVLAGGCVQQGGEEQKCPACQNPGKWSDCIDGVRSRAAYACSPDTNYTCKAYPETKNCLTELRLKGGGMEAVVSPTADETISGIIKVEVTSVPEGTGMVFFSLSTQSALEAGLKDPKNLVIVRDTVADDGWRGLIDTAKVENGVYALFVAASYEGAPDSNPWIGYTSTQVIVKN